MLRKGTLLFTFLFCLSSPAFAEEAVNEDQSPDPETAQTQAKLLPNPYRRP